MPSKVRMERIEDRIKQELSNLILQRVNDPLLAGVYVNDVKVDRELAFADIYVSSVEGVEKSGEILDGFKHANGFLRHELSIADRITYIPPPAFSLGPYT